jgi:hypothetical protein
LSDSSEIEQPRPRFPIQRWATTAFIVFYVYSAAVMAIPPFGERLETALLKPVYPLVNAVGLFHRLRLFSPEPPKFTGHVRFYVRFTDGISVLWTYPRDVLCIGDPPGSFNRYLFYYVFWSYGDQSRITLPALARYIAAQNEEPGRQVAEVQIVEEIARIPTPEKGVGRPTPPADINILVCDYDVATGKANFADRVRYW